FWIFGGSHVPTFWEVGRLVMGLGKAAYTAGLMWVLYLALEPLVRRRWPQVIISWSRLLAGRFRDAEVGAHVLIGTAVGVGSHANRSTRGPLESGRPTECVVWGTFHDSSPR